MLGLFSKKSSSLLGIDIEAAAVTLLALSRQGNGYRVETYARQPLSPGVVQDRSIVDPEALARTLSSVLLRIGTGLGNVAVAVPDETVISKVIEVPAGLSELELEDQVLLEAEQYIPYPLEDAAIDFDRQGAVPGRSERDQVLLVACRREQVASLESVLALANLNVQVVETQSLARERCLSLLGAGKATQAVLDIGLERSLFNVMHDQRVIHVREQLFGSRQLQDALQRHGLTLEEVLLAQRHGLPLQDHDGEVLHLFEDSLVLQATHALQQFAESPRQRPVDLLLLAGAASRLEGLAHRVEERLGMTTRVANPFRDMSCSPGVDALALADQAPTLLSACGLALRGVH